MKSTEQEIDKIHDKITKINVALKSLERNKTKVNTLRVSLCSFVNAQSEK